MASAILTEAELLRRIAEETEQVRDAVNVAGKALITEIGIVGQKKGRHRGYVGCRRIGAGPRHMGVSGRG